MLIIKLTNLKRPESVEPGRTSGIQCEMDNCSVMYLNNENYSGEGVPELEWDGRDSFLPSPHQSNFVQWWDVEKAFSA